MTSPEHVVVEVDIKSNAYKQKIQKEFIQVFKDFSDVVNDNVLIIGEKYLHKYEKKHNKIEAERLEFSKKSGDCEKKPEKKKVLFQDPPWLQHEEYRYGYEYDHSAGKIYNTVSHGEAYTIQDLLIKKFPELEKNNE